MNYIETMTSKQKISDNITYSQVVKSNTATSKGIDNSPTEEHLSNIISLSLMNMILIKTMKEIQ